MGVGYIRALAVTSVFSLFALLAMAVQQQTGLQEPGYSLKVDSLVAGSNDDIVGLTVAFVNRTTDSIGGQLRIISPTGIHVLGSGGGSVHVAPESRQYVPIKLQLSKSIAAGEYPITMQCLGTDGHVLASALTILVVKPKQLMWLHAINTNALMRQAGDSLPVRVVIRNGGNTTERVRVVVSLPSQHGPRRFSAAEAEVPPSADTTIAFGYIIDRELMRMERFTITIAGMYANGDVFGNTSVNVQNASATRRYEDPAHAATNLWSYQPNRVTFIARNPFSESRSWQLAARGNYPLAGGKLDFNTLAYQWGAWNHRPFLSNTWLNYERGNMGITVGNIAESLETFVNGRGVKVYFSDSLKSEHVEIGVVERTFDLLGSDYRPDFRNGFTTYFRTRLGEGIPEKKRYIGTAVYERLPLGNSESFLYMSTFDLFRQALKDRIRLVADFGPALTRPLYGTDKGDDYRPALAAGLQLHASVAQYTISSTNYYSTGYYPGVRRGALQLNQRINRAVNRVNVWLAYSLYEYAPEYFGEQLSYRNDFLMSRAELGASFPLTDFVNLSLVPLHEYEQGNYYAGGVDNADPVMDLHAYRLSSAINWRSRNYRQFAYVQLEGGHMQSSVATDGEWQLRANLAYNYSWFNFNANLQHGNFSVIEAANNRYFNRGTGYRLGASASVQRDFMHKRLQVTGGLSYYDDSFSGQNWMGNARIQYAATKKTALFLLGQLYQYSTPYYAGSAMANIQMGIHQSLPRGGSATLPKKGNMELFLYQDKNNNGVFDQGDTPATNTMVMINNSVFVTGNDGKIAYNRVPYGTQQINIPMQQGWYAPSEVFQLASKRLQASIGLRQAGTMEGSVRYEYDERISFEVDAVLAGFTVIAKNTSGYVGRAVTDSQGKYVLFLPAGSYEISILDSNMPPHVYVQVPAQHMVVEANEINTGPVFVLKVEEKKVEIKRFSSP